MDEKKCFSKTGKKIFLGKAKSIERNTFKDLNNFMEREVRMTKAQLSLVVTGKFPKSPETGKVGKAGKAQDINPAPNKVPTEVYEQIRFVTWLAKNGIRHFAIPNGGLRSYSEAVKFKRCGVKAGVPDVCIPIPSGSYHGLYIELKRVKGGSVSVEQKEWINFLQSQGYYAEVAKGFDEAKRIVEYYLGLTPNRVA